jgi:hypothetical protein
MTRGSFPEPARRRPTFRLCDARLPAGPETLYP